MSADAELQRAALKARIIALIAERQELSASEFGRFALELQRWQRQASPVIERVVEACRPQWLGEPSGHHEALVAIPTDLFRHARIACHPPEHDERVFHSSGTTAATTSRHAMRDLDLYRSAALSEAKRALFAASPRWRLIVAAPAPEATPQASLSFMLGIFCDTWGDPRSVFVAGSDGHIDGEALAQALAEAEESPYPVALLGTAFAWVQAEEALASLPAGWQQDRQQADRQQGRHPGQQGAPLRARRFAMPAGSFAMQTGGTKGRSRSVDTAELHRLIARRYGIPLERVVGEYGMTELSSQLYQPLGFADPQRPYAAPPWVRVRAVDASGRDVAPGDTGLLVIDDLANLDSSVSIQTADVGRVTASGVQLEGRSREAPLRGCSLTFEGLAAADGGRLRGSG